MSLGEPHCIRLHGPWMLRRDGVDVRLDLPGLVPAGIAGMPILERSFGKPTNLVGKSVALALAGLPAGTRVELNGKILVPTGEVGFRCGIDDALQARNALRLIFTEQTTPFAPFEYVRLEIAG